MGTERIRCVDPRAFNRLSRLEETPIPAQFQFRCDTPYREDWRRRFDQRLDLVDDPLAGSIENVGSSLFPVAET